MMSKFITLLNLVVISLVIGVAVNCLYLGLFNYSIITTNRLGVRIIKTNGVDDDADIIHRYQEEDVVTCLNQLSLINKGRYNNETVQIAFVGDSTIRNVFKSFLRMIPDYDMKGKTKTTFIARYQWNGDRQVTSELLNLRVAFYWRHLADEKLLSTFRNWTSSRTPPDFIVMGILAHHIATESFELFSKGLTDLKPIFNQLTKRSVKIVWMIQPLGPKFWPEIHFRSNRIDSNNKIHHYNKEARFILKDTGVKLSPSIEQFGLEYTHSCTQNMQKDIDRWHICNDGIHTGFVVLEHGTQVLLNEMCNDHLVIDLPASPVQNYQHQKQDITGDDGTTVC